MYNKDFSLRYFERFELLVENAAGIRNWKLLVEADCKY